MRPDEARWPLVASSGLIWLGGLDFKKNERQFCSEFLYVKHLIWSHFGASAGQGPFWRSPGDVWGQVWERYEELKSRQYLKVPRTLCYDFGGFVVVLLSIVVALLLALPHRCARIW